MPNTLSAKKRVRQTESRTFRNKRRRSAMKTWLRKVREAVEAGDKAAAQGALTESYRAIDKAAKSHVIHANKAANMKQKLARKVNAL